MTARALPILRRRPASRQRPLVAWLALAVAAVGLFVLFRGQWTIPHDDDAAVFSAFNDLRDWVGQMRREVPAVGAVLGVIRDGTTFLAETSIDALLAAGWLGVIGSAGAIAWLTGGWRTAILATVGLGIVGALGLWDVAMQTLGLTLAAVALSVVIGIPLGVAAAKSDRFRSLISPVLDALQIMPQFAYLVPFVILFQIGPGPAALVTMVYAVPATIRITALGIRGVPSSTIEAAASLGATSGQVLRKVELPLSRAALALAVNQTIMLALSMVVITALINGPGLGVTILRAVQVTNVGAALEAGVAIVLLAIVFDRITEGSSQRFDARRRGAASTDRGAGQPSRARLGRVVSVAVVVAAVLAVVVTLVGVLDAAFPDDLAVVTFREPVNDAVAWIRTNFAFLTDGLKEGFTALVLNPLDTALTSAPFWLVLTVAGVAGWLISGPRAAVVAVSCLAGTAVLQLWEHSMETLATVLVGTAVTLLIGLALGVAAALSNGFSRALRPFLDIAQTLPAFVYLLPAIALFEPSRFTALVGAVIFAVPPVARLVEAGIRAVPPVTIEAALSAGASRAQLLGKVQLPIARPALLLASNQGIVMVLGMVVLGGLVGGGALGFDVVAGFSQRTDFGMGFAAGLCMVLLGIALDRISQGAGRRRTGAPPPSAGGGTRVQVEATAADVTAAEEATAPA